MIRVISVMSGLFLAFISVAPVLGGHDAGPSPLDSGPGFMNVLTVGADNTGEIDSTRAIQSAIGALPSHGGTVYFPAGTYLVGTITLPNDPKVVNIRGAGDSTILKMAKAEGPLIEKDTSTGRITGATISNFTILANPASVRENLEHLAVNVVGFGNSTFESITYKSTEQPKPASVGVLFNVAAYPYLTYSNTFRHIKVTGNHGPSRVIYFHNAGRGVAFNANIHTLTESWIYANTGIDIIVDGGDATKLSISRNLFESNTGATAVILGQSTVVEGNWFELNGTAIATSSSRSTDGSGSTIRDNYFSGDTKIFIDSINVKPLFYGNSGNITPTTFVGQGVTRLGETPTPSPEASTLSGGDGVLTRVSAAVTAAPDTNDEVTETLEYLNKPASVGPKNFSISVLAGFLVKNMNVGVVRQINGEPKPVAISAPPNTFWTSYANTDVHTIVIQVTFKLQRPNGYQRPCRLRHILDEWSEKFCGG